MPKKEIIEPSGAQPFWSGTISFGLVSVPVSLFPANRPSQTGLRIFGPDGMPLRRQYYSSETDRKLAPGAMTRGYEIEPEKFVVVTDLELERIAPEKSRDIDLREFVKSEDIPPVYYERGYYLAPENGSAKAYQLLATVMERTGRAGIATFVMRGKEYLIAIVAENGILRAETMRFKDEIRTPGEIGLPDQSDASNGLVRRFQNAIDKNSIRDLPRDELQDESAAELLQIIKSKQKGKRDLVSTRGRDREEMKSSELEGALRRSLAGRKNEAGTRRNKTARAKRSGRRRHSSGS